MYFVGLKEQGTAVDEYSRASQKAEGDDWQIERQEYPKYTRKDFNWDVGGHEHKRTRQEYP
jgi:hypothetical protein